MVLYDTYLKRIDALIAKLDGEHWNGKADLLRAVKKRVEFYKSSPMPYDNQLADLLDTIMNAIVVPAEIAPETQETQEQPAEQGTANGADS